MKVTTVKNRLTKIAVDKGQAHARDMVAYYRKRWTKRAFILTGLTFLSLPTLGAHIVDNFSIRPTYGNWLGSVVGFWVEIWILFGSKDEKQMDARIRNYALFSITVLAANMVVLWIIAVMKSHVAIRYGYVW